MPEKYSMSKEKVLCTGSAGFIGHHLVKELKARGFYVIGIDNLSNGKEEYANLADEFLEMDVERVQAHYLSGVKYLFHLAALPRVPYSIEFPEDTNDTNITQALSLFLTAKEANVEKIIYSSSSSVYGGQEVFPTNEQCRTIPLSPYAVQKLATEMYAEIFPKIYGVQTASLRYFNVYGEEQDEKNPYTGVLTKFLRMKREGQPLTVFGDGLQRRDFTYVRDVVAANILIAEKGNGVYNVGSGETHSIEELAYAISDNVVFVPPRIGDPPISHADNSRLRELGWKPSMDVVDWLEAQ